MILSMMNDTIKQALREAIKLRQRDIERFVLELRRIEKEEEEAEEKLFKSIQESHNG
jgi:hypothetical protein